MTTEPHGDTVEPTWDILAKQTGATTTSFRGVPRYVALLRGINVGGKNLIRMPALKACIEEAGFSDVSTYIQSGNVLFSSPERSAAKLTARIETVLSETFGYDATVLLRTRSQMQRILDGAPKGFGTDRDTYLYDVAFLLSPLTARSVVAQVPIKPDVDHVHAGPGVLYLRRLAARASSSRVSKLASMPIYKRMTLRNWTTTQKLVDLLDRR